MPKRGVNENTVAQGLRGIEIEVGSDTATPSTPISILSDDLATVLSAFLTAEMNSVEAERTTREKQWSEWRRQRLSQPESDSKSSPWPNASNVEVPMMQSKINLVYSKFNRAFGSKDPFWTVSTSVPELKAGAKAFTKFLESYSKNPYGLDLSAKRREILYDCITFGTQPVRVPWLTSQRMWKAPGALATGDRQTRVMTTHDGPALVPIKIEDFFIHPYWDDVQRAPWFGIRYRLTLEELRQREAMGVYENIDAIIGEGITELPANEQDELRRRGMSADLGSAQLEAQLWDIFEIRIFWDIDGDGQLEDCILYWEPKSGVFVRSEYNPLPFRDIEVLRFLKLPGQFYGLGEGEILQYLQKEITSIHNRRADNQTLSMMQVWQQKRGRGLIEDGDIYPGKVLKVDEIGDVQPFAFPDLSGSAFQSESIARAYADEASGASSPLAGIADPTMKSGAGASSTMFLAQQSGDMLASIADGMRDDWGTIGFYIVMQYIANLDVAPASDLSPEEQAAMTEILAIPLEELPSRLQIVVQTSDISQTKDAQKQNLLTVSQIYTGYAQQTLPLVQMIEQITAGGQNPVGLMTPTGRMAASTLVGAVDMMGRILDYFGIDNWEDYVPDVSDLKVQMALVDAQTKQTAAAISARIGGQGETQGMGDPVPGVGGGLELGGSGGPRLAGSNAAPQAGAGGGLGAGSRGAF